MTISYPYLTSDQRDIVEQPLDTHIFLEGPAGTGKTTAGLERVMQMLQNGVPGSQILVLVPQRTLAEPYYDLLGGPGIPAGSPVRIMTIGGLARRMVELFWPLVVEQANFGLPNQQPKFLTLESAQYFMAHLVRPLLAKGYFDSLTIDRNRLYSQILDNLNKAAAVGFSHTEIGDRLKTAWVGESTQTHIYEDAQVCAGKFRDFCQKNNLLDFSLQLEIFRNYLWAEPLCHDYLIGEFRHLVFDNLEEDIPLTADLLQEWLPAFDSSLLIFDQDGGYRQFLSADPETNYTLKAGCNIQGQFSHNFISSEGISTFGKALSEVFKPTGEPAWSEDHPPQELPIFHSPLETRFFPEMLDWVADEINMLLQRGTPPGEIVVLAPYLTDALRFSLVSRLDRLGIPSCSHRPSRALRDEPAAQCLLTFAALAHPQWELPPVKADLTYALIQALDGLDLVRAQMLADSVYKQDQILPFEAVKADLQPRITYRFGRRYDTLQGWLTDYADIDVVPLDHFLSRLFGEVLSQPGFGFHGNYNAASIAANLVESVKKFRRGIGDVLADQEIDLGSEYLQMVRDGVIAAQYLSSWAEQPEDAVYLAPAYTFLMANRPVDVHFWLDVGGRGWYERLYQPLTQYS